MLVIDERVRLRLGSEFIAHRDDLWPQSAPSSDWIRVHAIDILALLEQALRRDGQDVRRLPHRLHWLLWLLADLEGRRCCVRIHRPGRRRLVT